MPAASWEGRAGGCAPERPIAIVRLTTDTVLSLQAVWRSQGQGVGLGGAVQERTCVLMAC